MVPDSVVSDAEPLIAHADDEPGSDVVEEYLDWLTDLGIETVEVGDSWREASEYILRYDPALSDSSALETAEAAEATLLVGGDGDYDEVSDVPVERFRDGSA
jgi:hypothetical protein